MYRNFVAQHGYEPIGSEHRASEIFDFVSMLKMRSICTRTMLKILHSFYIILIEGIYFLNIYRGHTEC